ncbi:MAG TPA: hypothetical protein VE955_07400, partial [Candidatus Dormibacteraeota bacterium]|nr:hypothetical protein [Candidatus Dormibacteraeota bacterium]
VFTFHHLHADILPHPPILKTIDQPIYPPRHEILAQNSFNQQMTSSKKSPKKALLATQNCSLAVADFQVPS